jgi:CHAD domain-containing protein
LLNSLGAARDWDVFVTEMIAPLKKKAGAPLDGASPFHRTVRIAQMRARLQARDVVASTTHTALLLELLRWFETRGWRTSTLPHPKRLRKPIKACAGKILKRQFDRARARGKNFDKLSMEKRHRFRIALKTLRYTAELLQPVLKKKPLQQFIRSVKPLQDSLGHLNDVSTAQELVAHLVRLDPTPAVARDGGIVLGWHERVVKADDPRLCRRVRQFCNRKPAW